MAERDVLDDIAVSLRRIADALAPQTSASAYLLGHPLKDYPADVQLAFIKGDAGPAWAYLDKLEHGHG